MYFNYFDSTSPTLFSSVVYLNIPISANSCFQAVIAKDQLKVLCVLYNWFDNTLKVVGDVESK
jgi:hypothetical protein